MTATVAINEWNGTGAGVKTDKTSGTIRFKNAGNAVVDLNDPLVVPASGQQYSFEKWLRLGITGGTFTQITNVRAYTDGANGFGTGIKLWGESRPAYDGTNGPQKPSEASDPPVGDSGLAMADAFAWTQAAPLSLGAGPFTAVGDIGDFLLLVLEVEATATQGVLPAETLTFAYDEI